jgi:membrane protease YdiL (CAAX protease family)
MKTQSNTLVKLYAAAILVIIPLVAAAWLTPPGFPMLLRQVLLFVWGVGATLAAERLLFSRSWRQAWQAVGFVPARLPAMVAALLASLPMWLFLPLLAWLRDIPIQLQPGWPALLVGVILVNGLTEEVLHRGFVFGHSHQEHSFVRAATLSALLFAAQHLYLVFSLGWTSGLASVLLAALLAFPLAYSYARGGNSLGGPAILHTSSNAPMLILALPQSFVATALLPHMGVVLVSIYLVFLLDRVPARPAVKAMTNS